MGPKPSSHLFGSTIDLAALITFKVVTIALAVFAFKCAKSCGAQFINGTPSLLTMGTGLIYFVWPFVLIFGAILFASLGKAPRQFRPRFLLALLPLYCTLFTAMWGALKWRDMTGPNLTTLNPYNEQMLTHIFHLNIGITIALLLLFKGHRFFFLGLFGMMQCYYLGVIFCATMAVTGVWL